VPAVTAPLWSVRLDDGGSLSVWPDPDGRPGVFRLRVTLPHPDYLGPDVVSERVLTRERVRQLWRVVR
jgi:hypothetical protein